MPARALLPTQRAVCRGWGRSRVCADCLRRFAQSLSRCHACAIGVPAGTALCAACVHQPPPLAHAIAGVDDAFPWVDLVAAFKFRAALDLAPALAWLLADAARADPAPRPSLLLPVPLSAERLAERGMNQAWDLARRVGAQTGIEARAAQRLRGRAVALVDDVMTSGATAAQAARVLLAGGASEVQVRVVARTPASGDQ